MITHVISKEVTIDNPAIIATNAATAPAATSCGLPDKSLSWDAYWLLLVYSRDSYSVLFADHGVKARFPGASASVNGDLWTCLEKILSRWQQFFKSNLGEDEANLGRWDISEAGTHAAAVWINPNEINFVTSTIFCSLWSKRDTVHCQEERRSEWVGIVSDFGTLPEVGYSVQRFRFAFFSDGQGNINVIRCYKYRYQVNTFERTWWFFKLQIAFPQTQQHLRHCISISSRALFCLSYRQTYIQTFDR